MDQSFLTKNCLSGGYKSEPRVEREVCECADMNYNQETSSHHTSEINSLERLAGDNSNLQNFHPHWELSSNCFSEYQANAQSRDEKSFTEYNPCGETSSEHVLESQDSFSADNSVAESLKQEQVSAQSDNSSDESGDELFNREELADLLRRYHAKFRTGVTVQSTFEDEEKSAESNCVMADVKKEAESDSETSDAVNNSITDAERINESVPGVSESYQEDHPVSSVSDSNGADDNPAERNRCPLCRRIFCNFRSLKHHIERKHLNEEHSTQDIITLSVGRQRSTNTPLSGMAGLEPSEVQARRREYMRNYRKLRREAPPPQQVIAQSISHAEVMRQYQLLQRLEEVIDDPDRERRALEAKKMRDFRHRKRLQETEEQAQARRAIQAQRARDLRQKRREQETDEMIRERRALEALRMRESRRKRQLEKRLNQQERNGEMSESPCLNEDKGLQNNAEVHGGQWTENEHMESTNQSVNQ